ncbi:MAG: DUF1353 domain-containing protein [Magnetococcales bacterium]|nr:DUF1353 domain-containing protein [Magnetococcales bacterium]MBF0151547.1 DUF1353 domain-containing protein [Magnetococcales bacterium]
MRIIYSSPLSAEWIDGVHWRLNKDFTVIVHDDDGSRDIRIPAGFVTDFASVPRLPGIYLFSGGVGHQAATLHDWLYRNVQIRKNRAWADRVFLAALHADGVSWVRSIFMWLGVRIFGWLFWMKR